MQKFKLYLDLIRWDKPVGWLLLLWPTLMALWLAAGGFPGWHLFVVFALGTIVMRSAGCAINDYADRDIDKHVERTQSRPLTSGKISSKEALDVALVLALVAFALVLTCNMLTVLWSIGAVCAAAVYPFSKRWIAMPQAVLGVAFSFGIPMAFAAVRSSIPAYAAVLVLANIAWVIAYDTEYALVDLPDDLKLNIRTSAITLGRYAVPAIVALYLLALGCWVGVWWHTGLMQHSTQLILAGIGGAIVLAQIAWHYRLIRTGERVACFQAFKSNHWIGCTVFITTVALLLSGK